MKSGTRRLKKTTTKRSRSLGGAPATPVAPAKGPSLRVTPVAVPTIRAADRNGSDNGPWRAKPTTSLMRHCGS